MARGFPVLLLLSLLSAVAGQQQQQSGVCGPGTSFDSSTTECLCTEGVPDNNDDPNVISIAGIFDVTSYPWGPDVFNITVQLINQGKWDVLPPGVRLEYEIENTDCDETTAVRKYWKLRTANGNKPVDGIVGARCSGASVSLARISGLEGVPQLSPASNSAKLSDESEFPFFSRLVAPNNENGEVGALIAMLRVFGWERVTVLATDTVFAKDLVNEFRKSWVGTHEGWVGEVAYSDTIRVSPDGSIDMESVQQVLKSIPTDKPSVNSRVIFLAAHNQHAFPVLEQAHQQNFQPDTIWVGPSAWVGRGGYEDYSWLPEVPGYLGVTPYRNRDAVYGGFMTELKRYQSAQGKEVLEELPSFAAETVDSIRALAWAIATADDRRSGTSVVQKLRSARFAGVSGYVSFTSEGDRKNPQFSLFNAQTGSAEGASIHWTDIGTTGTEIGSASLTNGIQGVCFAGVRCGLSSPPDDTYPVPKVKLPAWVFVLFVGLGLLLAAAILKYWRSHGKKRIIKAELEAFRKSVVGMRAAECKYIPRVSKRQNDIQQSPGPPEPALVDDPPQWMWRETEGYMDQHDASKIFGNPTHCWILYDGPCSKRLEEAYRGRAKECSPLPGYMVNFTSMKQTKVVSGFEREVQRVDVAATATDDSDGLATIDFAEVEVGDDVPSDLEGEPRLVLVEGDVLQISQQRQDGWAFGTKLHHADEAAARQLLAFVLDGTTEDEANVFADTGWFQLDKTRPPTTDDLATLKKNVGDTGVLDQPDNWDDVADASVVQKHELKPGDPERVAVENAFCSSLGRDAEVIKVERIQNLAMYQSYVVKRQTICYRETGHVASGDNDDIQRKARERFERKWLFHGTSHDKVDKILQQGFNRSFAGINATAYGRGVYFARDASYSADPRYAVPDSLGRQYIMACTVVVGEYCRGKHDALTPDVRDHKTQTLYDATIGTSRDSMSNPSIYVTYHDAQAYPEYLIVFKTGFSPV